MQVTNASVLCCAHFHQNDFKDSLGLMRSFGLKVRALLKPDAVPSIGNYPSESPPRKKRKLSNYMKMKNVQVLNLDIINSLY